MPSGQSSWSISGQWHDVLSNPLTWAMVMVNTFLTQYDPLLAGVVGRLGWGWFDVLMPSWYYYVAAAMLACALVAPGNAGRTLRPALIAIATFLCLLTGVFGALYLTWTPVGKPTIDGLQGRYILPVLPLLGWIVPAYGRGIGRLFQPAWYAVLLFPLTTLAVLPAVIMQRYYGSWHVMADSLGALLPQ
jgi:uncharacterized membrane protein